MRWIQRNKFGTVPLPRLARPALRVLRMRGRVGCPPNIQDIVVPAVPALHRRHVPDGRVTVMVVVPIDELRDPCPGIIDGLECAGVTRAILQGPEHRLGVRIVIAHAGTGVARAAPRSKRR